MEHKATPMVNFEPFELWGRVLCSFTFAGHFKYGLLVFDGKSLQFADYSNKLI